ncbi:hypothetical protein PQR53_33185 [Paraburkholderia fungorum]|uniref:hypothetical protein n=1 Tax=Paraburkholderia fungorum TaxID=134537 RepID=UPI0038BAABDA
MPTNEHRFSFEELLIALLRAQGIHEGHWTLNVEFAATGTSVRSQAGSTKSVPGLLISVAGATLVRANSAAEGAVEAAVVNPLPSASPARTRRTKKASTRTIQ